MKITREFQLFEAIAPLLTGPVLNSEIYPVGTLPISSYLHLHHSFALCRSTLEMVPKTLVGIEISLQVSIYAPAE